MHSFPLFPLFPCRKALYISTLPPCVTLHEKPNNWIFVYRKDWVCLLRLKTGKKTGTRTSSKEKGEENDPWRTLTQCEPVIHGPFQTPLALSKWLLKVTRCRTHCQLHSTKKTSNIRWIRATFPGVPPNFKEAAWRTLSRPRYLKSSSSAFFLWLLHLSRALGNYSCQEQVHVQWRPRVKYGWPPGRLFYSP